MVSLALFLYKIVFFLFSPEQRQIKEYYCRDHRMKNVDFVGTTWTDLLYCIIWPIATDTELNLAVQHSFHYTRLVADYKDDIFKTFSRIF